MGPVKESVPARVVRKFMEDQASHWAVLIAWNALFAMFPILLVMAALLGAVLHVTGFTSKAFFQELLAVLRGSAADTVTQALTGVQNQAGWLAVVGLLGLVWGGSALFGMMDQAFACVYHTRPRPFVRQKVMSIGMIALFTFLAGVAVLTSSLLPALKSLPNIPYWLTHGVPPLALQVVIGVLAGFLLYLAVYFFVPNRKRAFPAVWPGALLAGFLFEAVTLIFPLYLSLNRGINAYGKTFGLFFVLLTFSFFVGLITMLGAELNSVLYPAPSSRSGEPTGPVPPRAEIPAKLLECTNSDGMDPGRN
jgi:membrane protein